MKITIKKITIYTLLLIQVHFFQAEIPSVYNNARLIFHAIGPKFHLPGLEGIDPSVSIEAMETTLGNFVEKNPGLSDTMRDCLANAQKSLASARTNYCTCIGLVTSCDRPNAEAETAVDKLALQLAQDVKSFAQNETSPSILFIGGHYLHPKGGSLGGHTASYETVHRQANGKLSFTVNNTVKTERHTINENRIHQLVYPDLETTDLDIDFWKNVIKTNYMNPIRGKFLMESFYDYLDTKLLKGSNKISGRSFKSQEKGVCAWKAISVWLHGKIAPGDKGNRDVSRELIYTQYKKFMFENMLANFKPDSSLNQQTAASLKAALEQKIQKMDIKINFYIKKEINTLKLSSYVTVVVMVPEDYADTIREVMGKAGAGKTEHYSFGSFSVKGTSRFIPQKGSHPFIGTQHHLETVVEERIETICSVDILDHVLEEIKKAHPYEETIIDIYPIYENGWKKPSNN